MSEKSKGERALALYIQDTDLPEPEREYRWAAHLVGPGRGVRQRLAEADLRDWRFDFAWPSALVAVEVEGGTWAKGRHVRGRGYAADCEKYNAAQLHGWTVLRFTTEQVIGGRALVTIKRALGWGAMLEALARRIDPGGQRTE